MWLTNKTHCYVFYKKLNYVFCVQWHLNRTVLQRHVSSEKRRLEKRNFLKYFDKKENYNYKSSF